MTAIRYPITDHQGRLIPPGATRHVLEWDALTGPTLPGWITKQGGELLTQTAETGRPGVILSPPGSGMYVNIGGPVARDGLVAARLDLMGVRSLGSTASRTLYLRLDDAPPTDGAVLNVTPVPGIPAKFMTRTGGSATVWTETTHDWTTPAGTGGIIQGARVGLMLDLAHGSAWAMEGDEPVGYTDVAVSRSGLLHPRLQYVSNDESQLLIGGIRLELWYD